MTPIILLLLLAVGLMANAIWTFYLFRRNKLFRPMASPEMKDWETRTERLLTEIHRVTSANVEFLEDRIEALREVGGVADERLKRIRETLTELEVILNRVHRVKKSVVVESVDPVAPSMKAPSSRVDTVAGLSRQGLSERQIAEKMGLSIPEIRFLLKLSTGGGRPDAPPVEKSA